MSKAHREMPVQDAVSGNAAGAPRVLGIEAEGITKEVRNAGMARILRGKDRPILGRSWKIHLLPQAETQHLIHNEDSRCGRIECLIGGISLNGDLDVFTPIGQS